MAESKHDELEAQLSTMIMVTESKILKGRPFTIFGGDYTMVPVILLEESRSTNPNANLTPVDDSHLGLQVNNAMLEMSDTTGQLFAIAHELGHGFGQKLLSDVGCEGISGVATEV